MSEVCQYCGGNLKFKETPDMVHYGKIFCTKCDRHIKWVQNPKKVNAGRLETSKYRIDRDFCQFCGRKNTELGNNETLTIHHSIPLTEGGKDEPKNICILCSACHKLAHWHRLYNYTHWRNADEQDTESVAE